MSAETALRLDEDSASWRNGCESKTRYTTRAEAKRRAKAVERRHHPLFRLYPYQCRHCAGWHLTSRAPA